MLSWIQSFKLLLVQVKLAYSGHYLRRFLVEIAALYVAMSVGRSVGRLVGVNEFQRALNALKVYVMNKLKGIMKYKIYSCIYKAQNKMHIQRI